MGKVYLLYSIPILIRHAIANGMYSLIELFLSKEVEHKVLGGKRRFFFSFIVTE